MKELDLWLAKKRKKKESRNESSDEENETNEVVTTIYELLLGTENELTKTDINRILRLGFDQYEIVIDGFVREYKSVQEKSDKEVHKVLYSHLKERGLIIDSDKEDTDESGSQRTPEIEILESDRDSDSEENVINTPTFGSSQNSDSNNSNLENLETESELSDLEIPIVPIIAMATLPELRRTLEAALGLPANTLDNVVAAGIDIAARIENAGNEAGGAISLPIFSGKEEEDVNDWIRQFEVAFTAIGKNAGNNGTRQAAWAATCLKGAALQWYNEMKELNNGNLINWVDANNDNDLKNRIVARFTREDVRRRKMLELKKIKQGINERVEEYTGRFRKLMRMATRGVNLAGELQVDFYIEGLEPTLAYNVRKQNPGNLNDAINQARREEEARNELLRKTMETPRVVNQVYPEIGNTRTQESVRIQNNEQVNRFAKPLNENYEDELVKAMEEKMRINQLERQIQNMERRLNNRNRQRTQTNYDNITCFRCDEKGHYATRCPRGNNWGNDRRINVIDTYDDEDYESSDYEDGTEEMEEDIAELKKLVYDLYAKDTAAQERRKNNRLNPMTGWQNFGKPNLEKEMAEARNRMNVDYDIRAEEQPMYDRPIGPEPLPKGMKWSSKRNQIYDPTEGLRKWREQGGKPRPRESKVTGVQPTDKVDYENLLNLRMQEINMIKKMLKKGDSIN